ncbi:hypothetical protein [Bacillus sp. JCM 19034]|uniref:hypothetical protein n=1 Tax=Bacillus sp. JCM 19034 TaxID=1481928 RepID=UPI00078157AE|nr:hypothetical protein [Bacillus sp. JCM 19034]
MRKRKWVIIAIILVVIMSPLLVYATTVNDEQTQAEDKDFIQANGSIDGKDEVIYANLSASGSLKDLYVVNIFDVIEEGSFLDYGYYEQVKNLTDLAELELSEDTVRFVATEGKFYYQGYLQDQPLPWEVNVSYLLNGESIRLKIYQV